MYNRYIRNESGSYTRIPQEESPRPSSNAHSSPPKPEPPPRQHTPPPPPPPSTDHGIGHITDGLTGFLRHILDQLHMDHVDTGDLLLLILLFFLFREDADEELLVALGLLLIL